MSDLYLSPENFKTPISIDSLSHERDFVIKLQSALIETGWLKGNADGIIGKQTKSAWIDFKNAHYQKDPELIGAGSIELLIADLADLKGNFHPVPRETKLDLNPPNGLKLPSGKLAFKQTEIVAGIPLTWHEVTKNLTRRPSDLQIENNIVETAKVFGSIRSKMGVPLTINSGYRPAAINRQVGGVSNSQHVRGLALDISCGNLDKLLAVTRQVIRERGSGGIGLGMRRGFIHFDIGRNRKGVVEFGY